MKKILQYFKTHLIAAVILEVTAVVLALALLFQYYLKREYLDYLQETSRETEEAVLGVVKNNVDAKLRNLIGFGVEMATSERLHAMVRQSYETEAERRYLLQQRLESYQYPEEAVCAALVGAEGMAAEYDRYRGINHGIAMWNRENEAELMRLYQRTLDKFSGRTVGEADYPKLVVSETPAVHPFRTAMRVVHVGIPLVDTGSGGRISYVLVLTLRLDLFEEALELVRIPQTTYAHGVVTNRENVLLYSANSAEIGKELSDFSGEQGAVFEEPLGYFGWKVVVWLDETQMRAHVDAIYQKGVAAYLALLLLLAAAAALLLHYLLRPVARIAEAMRAMQGGEAGQARIRIGGRHEIWRLAEEYNRMADRLEEKSREAREQHEQAILGLQRAYDAEREALESQISAHFICNTLGTINYEAIEAGNDKVSVMLKKLSNILRYTFDRRLEVVYLRQEIAWIEQYLYLQKERYEEMFDYEIQIDERYADWPCEKLMLQPFVENSILHAFAGRRDGGRIRITARFARGRLAVVLADNGCGMDRETEDRLREIIAGRGGTRAQLRQQGKEAPARQDTAESETGTGVGIRNVLARMEMFYGKKLDVAMETAPGKGTVFTFLLPLPPAE